MSTPSSIKLTKITPKEYQKLPKPTLTYGTTPSKFGNCLAAFRNNALCYLSFFENESKLEDLKKCWPNSPLQEDNNYISEEVSKLFDDADDNYEICLRGTDFEMRVWEALLGVEKGTTVSYEDVAIAVGNVKAVRAAARAVAKNKVAYFIPCHRIIKKNGSFHKYRGGVERKVKMLQYEGAI